MAIAFDAISTKDSGSPGTSQNWSHTTTGSELIIIVCNATRAGGQAASSVTYAGSTLTEIRTDSIPNSTCVSDIWYRVAPATGANTVVVNFQTSPNNFVGASITLTGVDQTNPIDAHNGDASGNTAVVGPATVVITTVANNCWLINSLCIRTNITGETVTADASQTERHEIQTQANGIRGASSTELIVTGGTTDTQSWTFDADSAPWALSVASIKPSGGTTHYGTVTIDATATLSATALRKVYGTTTHNATATLSVSANRPVRVVYATVPKNNIDGTATLTATAVTTTPAVDLACLLEGKISVTSTSHTASVTSTTHTASVTSTTHTASVTGTSHTASITSTSHTASITNTSHTVSITDTIHTATICP